MIAPAEIGRVAAQFHLDALLGVVAVAAVWFACRRHAVRRGAAPDFSDAAGALALAVPFVGGVCAAALVAEASAARGAVLGITALLAAVILLAATGSALLRAELRRRAETERQLQKAKAEADEASRAKGDFLAVMSHEIRTPLNAVMGFAHLLDESPLDDTQRSHVATILSEGARLGTLLNDILDLTKIDKGRLVLESAPFSPIESAQDVIRLFGPRARQRGLELRLDAAACEASLILEGDALRLRQIIVNLVDNALKFTPSGSVTIALAWAAPVAGAPHGRLALRVRDTGIGIPPAKIGRLFQMFTQADSSTTRRYGGTGLGLAICQRLVHLMGGEIAARSEPGAGTEFAVALPLPPFAAEHESRAQVRRTGQPALSSAALQRQRA
jgi:two-component system, sensor histidine kinase